MWTELCFTKKFTHKSVLRPTGSQQREGGGVISQLWAAAEGFWWFIWIHRGDSEKNVHTRFETKPKHYHQIWEATCLWKWIKLVLLSTKSGSARDRRWPLSCCVAAGNPIFRPWSTTVHLNLKIFSSHFCRTNRGAWRDSCRSRRICLHCLCQQLCLWQFSCIIGLPAAGAGFLSQPKR